MAAVRGEEQEEVVELLKRLVPYIEQTHDDAAALHDSYGPHCMDECLYMVMQDAQELIESMIRIIGNFEAENKKPPWR